MKPQKGNHNFDFCASGKRTIRLEKEALGALELRIGPEFIHACQLMLNCNGRIVVMGVGKSGHIGKKIAATLASTGSPAFFVHPAEACHGDLGMITPDDTVLAISNSGSSAELLALLPLFKRMQLHLISLTGKTQSPLASFADCNIDIGVTSEACPHDLAPTSSTTVTLAMGDALAVALLEARGFTAEDFAFSHPAGTLGKKLLLRVSDIMHNGQQIPCVPPTTALKEALREMTTKGFGMTTVVDSDNRLLGIFTDGDLRRCIDQNINIDTIAIEKVMTVSPLTINKDILAAAALNIMEKKKVTALVVENDDNTPIGVLHMHDLLRAGII
ncbi:MAG: D-arabinose 5-phosphate isomerase [Alteromonadaceae bacterium]|nr:MAG: D-arabinose 5-phosphate isomerase [Alteromonadaceae bacterium]